MRSWCEQMHSGVDNTDKLPVKHAVITGAADGIGKALAAAFGARGYRITGVDVNGARAAAVQHELAAQGITISFLLGDLSTPDDVERISTALADGAPIDVLVHNAGINCVGAFARTEFAHQQAVLDVNLRAPLHLTAAVLRADKIVAGGSLVFISSLSHYVSFPGAAVYAASKDALAAYARSLAVALAPQRIHVLTVYPGPTRTAHAHRYSPDNRRAAQRMPPETLAAAICRAVEKRQRRLIPGFRNRLAAWFGVWFPGSVEWVMRKTMFEKVEKARHDRA